MCKYFWSESQAKISDISISLELKSRKLTRMSRFPENEKSGKIGLHPTNYEKSCAELNHPKHYMRTLILLFSVSILLSQPYIGEGLTGPELLQFLQSNYTPAFTLGYDHARDTMYAVIDVHDGNQITGIYSGYTITLDPALDPSADAYNKGISCEHTFPQSMGAGSEPQKSNMHHLFPCKTNVNSSRGNDPFAEIPDELTSKWYRNDYYITTIPTEFIDEYAEKYNPSDPTNERFEPRESKKGDIARAMFYFYAIYNDVADDAFWELQKDDLFDWTYLDPPDSLEINRTWMIASYQDEKPNLFVLDNSLALRLWFEDRILYGCMDPTASNFNPEANMDDGFCLTWFFGDVSQDSQVDVLDIVLMVSFILETVTPDENQLISGDVNCDQAIDVVDIVIVVDCVLSGSCQELGCGES